MKTNINLYAINILIGNTYKKENELAEEIMTFLEEKGLEPKEVEIKKAELYKQKGWAISNSSTAYTLTNKEWNKLLENFKE